MKSINLQASNMELTKKVKELQQTSQSLEVSLSKRTTCSVYLYISVSVYICISVAMDYVCCSNGLCLLLVLAEGTI